MVGNIFIGNVFIGNVILYIIICFALRRIYLTWVYINKVQEIIDKCEKETKCVAGFKSGARRVIYTHNENLMKWITILVIAVIEVKIW